MNSPSIAGTGRVGPRQRTRVTYSHSDIDTPLSESESFFRQKSFEDKSKGTYFNNQKFSNLKRSHSQKKKENETKYQYHQKKDIKKEDCDGNSYKHYDNEFKSYTQKDQQKSYSIKSSKPSRGNMKITKPDSSSMNVSQKHEHSDEVKFEKNSEPNIEHNTKQNLEQNIEHVVENSNILQEITSEANKTSNTENVQSNVENEITSGVLLTKEAEIEEISLTSISSTDNSDYIAKRDLNKNSMENKNEYSDSFVNNITEDLQENSNMSSEVSVPNNIRSNEEFTPNESNEVLNNVEENTILLHKDDQQSSKQITKQFINNDCDNIEGEITVQRSIEEVNNSVSLLEDKTHSVIETNNQLIQEELVQEEQLVQKETLNLEKETDLVLENQNESSDKNSENIMNSCEIKSENIINSCEIKSENILDSVNVDKNSVGETMEKIEKTDEKGMTEENKTLQ